MMRASQALLLMVSTSGLRFPRYMRVRRANRLVALSAHLALIIEPAGSVDLNEWSDGLLGVQQ